MTGMSEMERINAAARSIIEGEKAADAKAFAGLHGFIRSVFNGRILISY